LDERRAVVIPQSLCSPDPDGLSPDLVGLLVAETQDLAMVVLDAAGNVVTWNVGAERLTGYVFERVLGLDFSVLYTPADIAAGVPGRELATVVADGRLEGSGWRVREDGGRFWASFVLTALHGNDGTLRGYGLVIRDLEMRWPGERPDLALGAAEDSRLILASVANVSHELRTSLSGVIGMAELLLDSDLDTEQSEYAAMICASGGALISVIDGILDFSRIDAGRVELDEQAFDVGDLAESVCAMLAVVADAKGLELLSWVDEAVAQRAIGDGPRVRQVAINLVANAVKFTAAGEVVLHVSEDPAGTGGGLRFEVRDTGIGVELSRASEIFEPFTQADSSTSRLYGGTGLGLAISRQLVELMGGEIGLESTLGVGSTFWFTVPVAATPPDLSSDLPSALNGLRTLAVDDNASSRRNLKRQFDSWGMIATTAGSGGDALASLRSAASCGTPIGLVVLDSKMPRMSGLQLATAIRSDPALRATRLLLLVAPGESRRAAVKLGVDGFVAKPIRAAALRGEIVRVLERPVPAIDRSARRVVEHAWDGSADQVADEAWSSANDLPSAQAPRPAGIEYLMAAAVRRDVAADERDVTAVARDQASGARSLVMSDGDADHDRVGAARRVAGAEVVALAGGRRRRAAAERARHTEYRSLADADRRAGARDRADAARDRLLAVEDLEALAGLLSRLETDAVTGARIRVAGLEDLDREVGRCRRTSGLLAVAYVDIVGLKLVNDGEGHGAGDAMLKRVVTSIRGRLRPYDLVVRLGGDEFLCVMPGIPLAEANRRFGLIASDLAGGPHPAVVRVGFALLTGEETAANLIARADRQITHGSRDA
jgi:diguanylate cyclase (GGDEF)-like protein/PAS domain S-box-containing protein